MNKGWLNVTNGYWAVMSEVPLILQYYTYKNETYYKIPNQGYYMSVSRHAYVGFYSWHGATAFTLEDGKLKSNYNHHQLSFYSDSDKYLYCWDSYSVFNPVELADA